MDSFELGAVLVSLGAIAVFSLMIFSNRLPSVQRDPSRESEGEARKEGGGGWFAWTGGGDKGNCDSGSSGGGADCGGGD